MCVAAQQPSNLAQNPPNSAPSSRAFNHDRVAKNTHPIWTLLAPSTYKIAPPPKFPDQIHPRPRSPSSPRGRTCPPAAGQKILPPPPTHGSLSFARARSPDPRAARAREARSRPPRPIHPPPAPPCSPPSSAALPPGRTMPHRRAIAAASPRHPRRLARPAAPPRPPPPPPRPSPPLGPRAPAATPASPGSTGPASSFLRRAPTYRNSGKPGSNLGSCAGSNPRSGGRNFF